MYFSIYNTNSIYVCIKIVSNYSEEVVGKYNELWRVKVIVIYLPIPLYIKLVLTDTDIIFIS